MRTPPKRLLARAVGADHEPIDPRTYRTRRCHDADGDPVAPADAAAALLIGQLRRVVVDSKRVVIDLGRRSRLFTGSARTAAQLQYWRCTHPGCGVPTKHSQIDHANPWGGAGRGTTTQNNAHIKCGHHNRFKQSGYTTWRDTTRHLAHPPTRRHRNHRRVTAARQLALAATGLTWANMLRPFQLGKARTSHEGPSSWTRPSRVASAHDICPACHFTNASASAVM